MKQYIIILVGLFSILLFVGVALFWPNTSTTSIQLSGTTGTPITGFYVQDGHRVAVSASLPLALHGADITQFEFRRTDPDASCSYEIKRGGILGLVGRFYIFGGLGHGVVGLHGRLDHWSISIQCIRHDG